MIGVRRPAFAATLTNLASNGSPDGFPRGAGAMPREAMPVYFCASVKLEWTSPRAAAERTCRRVIALLLRISDSKSDRIASEMGCRETERREMGWRETKRGARVFAIFAAAAITAFGWQPTGAQLVNAGRFAEALTAFEGALRTDPKSVAANNGAGVALDLLGR